MFKCERWVDRRRQEDPGIVAVVVALPPDQAAAAGSRRSAKDRLLLGSLPGLGTKGSMAASAALHASAPQEVQGQAELGGSMHLAEAGGMEGLVAAAALPGYRVVFHTSRMCGSGTRAKVGWCPAGLLAWQRKPLRNLLIAGHWSRSCAGTL